MPIFKVLMRCQFEGVTDLEAPGDDFQYCVQIKCNSCNEVMDKWQYISGDQKVEIPGSRGICNYLFKCKLCNRVNSLDVLLNSRKVYKDEYTPAFHEIISFECRGLSIVAFRFGTGWQCKSINSRTTFTDINLDEEWCEYDEEANCPISISEVEYKIE